MNKQNLIKHFKIFLSAIIPRVQKSGTYTVYNWLGYELILKNR